MKKTLPRFGDEENATGSNSRVAHFKQGKMHLCTRCKRRQPMIIILDQVSKSTSEVCFTCCTPIWFETMYLHCVENEKLQTADIMPNGELFYRGFCVACIAFHTVERSWLQ